MRRCWLHTGLGLAWVKAAHWDARHAFHARSNIGLTSAQANLPSGIVDRLHAGTTKAVHGHATNTLGKACQQTDHTRHIQALLAFRHRIAQN